MQNEAIQYFKDLCKRHNLSITPQRMAVFEAFSQAKDHPTADEIYEKVRVRFPNMSLDTVYRTLSTFVEIGLAQIVEGYGEVKRYDPHIAPHHHFRCSKCNKLFDFSCDEYNNLKIPDEIQNQFNVSKIKVLLEGVCEECK